MALPSYRLDNIWHPDGSVGGQFRFTLTNLSDVALDGFRLVYTSMTRALDPAACGNATLLLRDANHHAVAPPDGLTLAPGEGWAFTVGGLHRPARHFTDGATSAYLTLASGEHVPVAVSDLLLDGRPNEPPPALLPEGRLDLPFAMQPWPRDVAARPGDAPLPVALFPAPGTALDELKAVEAVLALAMRLFPTHPAPFSLNVAPQGRALRLEARPELVQEGYTLTFDADAVRLAYGGAAGRQYGLTTLAQLLHGARVDAARFRFPVAGTVADAPRYEWRGCHLDVSRQFHPVADVTRLLDILAWSKLNVLQWHLTDDEAWRLEIVAFPDLTTVGARRGPDEKLRPQLGQGAEPVAGFYSQAEVRAVVAHAASLHVEVVPEIDIPGHNAATLVALPHLADGQEAPDSYHSVQGYANNALNPAIEETYAFLGTVFDEMASLFPSATIHIGGDEVAPGAWLSSPRAKALMAERGLAGTSDLQAHFFARVKAMLTRRGKRLAGWNEVAHGSALDPVGTLLMAWETKEVGLALAQQGYDVVMTPGQAYYLDMAQADAWQEPGASWAGTVPPAHTYAYEAASGFPDELRDRIKGVQACVWSEYFTSRAYFNRLVFPRLAAVAEAAWTPEAGKDWDRFAAIARLTPTL